MSNYPTMISRVDAYLAKRRQAGYELLVEGKFLVLFARFADRAGHIGPPKTPLTIRWATALRRPNALTSAYRLRVIRRFARHWQTFEPDTQVPPPHLFGRSDRRLTPHIYTPGELTDLIKAAAMLGPPGCLVSKSYSTIFGLFAATGLRISEALRLRRVDVHLADGVLHIRHSKFGKSRWVPVHPTVTAVLRQYDRCRDRHPSSDSVDAFFLGNNGQPVKYRSISEVFRRLRCQLNWQARGGHAQPRIHDLRHTFVCRRIECWAREESDVDANILALSTYIGHAKVTKTYWYVTGTPELLAIAANRFEGHAGVRS